MRRLLRAGSGSTKEAAAPPAAETVKRPSTARANAVALLAFGLLTAAITGAVALVYAAQPERGGVHQGFLMELNNNMTGGRYRVALHCRLKNNTAGFMVHAESASAARHTLEWAIPVCELTQFTEFGPAGGIGSGPAWFRGEFTCPANFIKRNVRLSAPDIDHAIAMASEGSAGCTVEYADQTACPWLNRGCDRRSVDFREAMGLTQRRLLR